MIEFEWLTHLEVIVWWIYKVGASELESSLAVCQYAYCEERVLYQYLQHYYVAALLGIVLFSSLYFHEEIRASLLEYLLRC